MTKKQVLFSLREVLSSYRSKMDFECSCTAASSEFDYYHGCVVAIDYFL